MGKKDDIALLKKNVIRRKFQSKAGVDRQKAPKIQRLITDARIRRKVIKKFQNLLNLYFIFYIKILLMLIFLNT